MTNAASTVAPKEGGCPRHKCECRGRAPGEHVSLLHRGRQPSLQAGWLRCAGRDVWRSYSIKQSSVSGRFFHPYLNEELQGAGDISQVLAYTKGSSLKLCLYKCVITELFPSWTLRVEGLCSTLFPRLTPMEKVEVRERRRVLRLSSTIYFPFFYNN